MAALSALSRDQQLVDALGPLALLDLVDLRVHPLEELLARQERLDVEGPEKGPRCTGGDAFARIPLR